MVQRGLDALRAQRVLFSSHHGETVAIEFASLQTPNGRFAVWI